MIESFRHKGLKALYEHDDPSKVRSDQAARIRMILSVLDAASTVDDMAQPTFRLHPLKDDLPGMWAATVRANWRIVFRFADGRPKDVDLIDYH